MKTTLRILTALVMTAIGFSHFFSPDPFVRIVPHFLPWPLALVYISGVCEIAGGIGLLPRRTRKLASWGLIALYLAVFPANINMAIHNIQLSEGGQIPAWAMWARLPMQALFIALVWWLGRSHIHFEGLSGEKGE